MRKFFFSLLFVTMACFVIFADDDNSKASSSSTMELSAYKEATTTNYSTLTVSLTYLPTSDSITGSSSYYPILDGSQSIDRLGSDYSLDEVFSIGITTSLKYNITAELTFTPFINMVDSSEEKIPATYKFYSSTANATTCTSNSTLAYVDVSTNSNNPTKCKYIQFTPKLNVTTDGAALSTNGTVTANTTSVPVTLTHSIATTKYSKNSNGSNATTYDGVPNEYESSGSLFWQSYSLKESDTLPGIGSKTVSTSATFGVSITEDDYNKMVANEYYASTITVTVTVQN